MAAEGALRLSAFPVGSEVLTPREDGVAWCGVVRHVEGKLLIQTPEGAREPLSLLDLKAWMGRAQPPRSLSEVARVAAAREEEEEPSKQPARRTAARRPLAPKKGAENMAAELHTTPAASKRRRASRRVSDAAILRVVASVPCQSV
eukprot:4435593-Prymnesium_polylepis.2